MTSFTFDTRKAYGRYLSQEHLSQRLHRQGLWALQEAGAPEVLHYVRLDITRPEDWDKRSFNLWLEVYLHRCDEGHLHVDAYIVAEYRTYLPEFAQVLHSVLKAEEGIAPPDMTVEEALAQTHVDLAAAVAQYHSDPAYLEQMEIDSMRAWLLAIDMADAELAQQRNPFPLATETAPDDPDLEEAIRDVLGGMVERQRRTGQWPPSRVH